MNILMIVCDQLSALALRSYGNKFDKSYRINDLAKKGILFEEVYTTCPLCQPARASLWTGKYPHQTKVLSNLPYQGFDNISTDILTIGDIFSRAGYECCHFGKTHDYGSLRGFKIFEQKKAEVKKDNNMIIYDYETYYDENTTRQVEKYFYDVNINNPFFVIVDFQNPHNICSYIGQNENGNKCDNKKIDLPDLPKNFYTEDMVTRPDFIKYQCCSNRRQRQTKNWTKNDYRYYLYAYHKYIEIVDKQIGRVLDALNKNNLKDDTLIIFTSDHGEGMGAHQLVTKNGAFYREICQVPLIFSGKGIEEGRRIKGVISHIDILPTIVDLVGINIEKIGINNYSFEGTSLFEQIKNKKNYTEKGYVISQWYDEYKGYRVPGRMLYDGQYKYIIYKDLDNEHKEIIYQEELYDLKNDSYETKNISYNNKLINLYRNKFKKYINDTNDDFYKIIPKYSNKYRNHIYGFNNHTGSNAVIDYIKKYSN